VPKRLLITGTREGWNPEQLGRWLTWAFLRTVSDDGPAVLVHGDAPGVDRQAAHLWGQVWGFPTEAHPADWKTYGMGAGPRRNGEMVDLGADLCIAFPVSASKGTWDCVRKAENAGIPVVLCNKEVPE
jgi:hypothetical protein